MEKVKTGKFSLFVAHHEEQLLRMGFPKKLYKPLYKKLKHNNYDAGNYLQILQNEDAQTFQSMARVPIQAESQAFLIDHAWIFQLRSMYESISTNDALLKRMLNILKFSDYKQPLQPEQHTNEKLLEIIHNLPVSD